MADEGERARFTKESEQVDIDPKTGRRQGMPWLTLFDRSAGSLLNPRFASEQLEVQYQRLSLEQTIDRLRFAAVYLALCSALWIVYFCLRLPLDLMLTLAAPEAVAIVALVILIGLTCVPQLFATYQRIIVLAILLLRAATVLVSAFLLSRSELFQPVPVFEFCSVLQVCLVAYSLTSLPLLASLLLGIGLSVAYIVCIAVALGIVQPTVIVAHALLLLAVQLIGAQLYTMSQVRRRTTFLRFCDGARIKQLLAHEKEAKNEMIRSLMPESVAKTIMTSSEEEGVMPNAGGQTGAVKFRKFNVNKLDNVSVLFADIVGFTNMSSGKSAPHLVYLLNDLFGRFDDLCDRSGCEKIATLGDCYYCVAGCPEPKEDHAECCVEMGCGMVVAIDQFDKDHEEAVNMRVGVHTGTVLCGIVGTMRFKFDVWSNDVTLANEMESSGKPGMVHISKDTYNFVQHLYECEEGEDVPDIRKLKVLIEYYDEKKKGYAIKHTQEEAVIQTFFVKERKDKRPPMTLEQKEIVKFHDLAQAQPPQEQELPTVTVEGDGATDDRELAQVISIEQGSASSTFSSPPISQLTLSFNDEQLEAAYRDYGAVRSSAASEQASAAALTDPRMSPLFDGVVQTVSLIAICAGVLLAAPLPLAVVAASVSLIVAVVFLLPLAMNAMASSAALDSLWSRLFSWLPRNLIGAVVVAAPAAAALAAVAGCGAEWPGRLTVRNAFMAACCSFALFTFFSSWTKSLTAVVIAIAGIALAFATPCFCPGMAPGPYLNGTSADVTFASAEFGFGIVQLLVLVLFLNRAYDISFRQTFHCEYKAMGEKAQINKEKKQAEWLLHNIIPYYIESEMSEKKTYSRNLRNVGVVFATISNFAEFYDEQFEGGTEMLRVLNEYFADIEALLSDEKYKDVEKIKSVGACFMAASGLNMDRRRQNADPDWDHLYALMDFCTDVIEKTEEFNAAMFNFNFELKIGFNIGEVTAGVIGSTKLLYDIWGDTVNVSSRMYSTGQKMRIQVTEDVAKKMESHYEFEHRGTTFVKGKGDLETYLLKGKK